MADYKDDDVKAKLAPKDASFVTSDPYQNGKAVDGMDFTVMRSPMTQGFDKEDGKTKPGIQLP
jgi:hypothetical protein